MAKGTEIASLKVREVNTMSLSMLALHHIRVSNVLQMIEKLLLLASQEVLHIVAELSAHRLGEQIVLIRKAIVVPIRHIVLFNVLHQGLSKRLAVVEVDKVFGHNVAHDGIQRQIGRIFLVDVDLMALRVHLAADLLRPDTVSAFRLVVQLAEQELTTGIVRAPAEKLAVLIEETVDALIDRRIAFREVRKDRRNRGGSSSTLANIALLFVFEHRNVA